MRAAMALLLVAALLPAAAAQTPEPLFNGRDLKGWAAEHAKAGVREGAIRVESSPGWVRTDEPFADFVLTFELRVRAGRAGVFVRGWPVFDKNSAPSNAFRITRSVNATTATDAEWEQWRVECRGTALRVLLGGVEVYRNDSISNPHGYVALWAHDGTAEFRSISIEALRPSRGDPAGVVTARTPGATIPKLLREVKPSYTQAAMARKIEGSVQLVTVVERDGTVGDVKVVRSLDSEFGLDASAIRALKGWKFRPALLDAEPIRMLVTVELKFTLR